MPESAFWNPHTETLSRDRLEALQERKLRDLLEWTFTHAPWQAARLRDAGVEPGSVTTLEDLARIPFLTRADWMAAQDEDPPYGPVLACPPEAAIRHHTTSGTSGSRPLAVLDGPKDWEWIAEMWCYAFWGFGVRPRDTVFFAFGYGTFVGFWGAHYACEKLGALVLPGGNMSTEARVRMLVANRGDGRLLDADLRAADGPGGAPAGHRPARLGGRAADPLRRARGLDPRDQGADRGAVGREGGRHRRA